MKRVGVIKSTSDEGVDLEAFAALISTLGLQRKPAVRKINPFTKKEERVVEGPIEARILDGQRVVGKIVHATSWPGELDVFGDPRKTVAVADKVAKALGAELKRGPRPAVDAAALDEALEGLDAVPWDTLAGPSSRSSKRVPGLLRAAVGSAKQPREEAIAELMAEFCQGSTASPAADALIPFLVALLELSLPDREAIASLLADFVRDTGLATEPEAVESTLEPALPLLTPFLKSEDEDVRESVADAIERITGDRPVPRPDVTAAPVPPRRPVSGIHEGTYRIAAALAAIGVVIFFYVRGAPKPMLIAASVAVIAIICLHIYERSKGR